MALIRGAIQNRCSLNFTFSLHIFPHSRNPAILPPLLLLSNCSLINLSLNPKNSFSFRTFCSQLSNPIKDPFNQSIERKIQILTPLDTRSCGSVLKSFPYQTAFRFSCPIKIDSSAPRYCSVQFTQGSCGSSRLGKYLIPSPRLPIHRSSEQTHVGSGALGGGPELERSSI